MPAARTRSLGAPRRAVLLLAILASAGLAVTGATAQDVSESPAPPASLTRLTVGLGYIPSVQFAPFYLADEAGYYRDAGLEVSFQNQIDPQLITLVGQGAVDIGVGDGTSIIPAVSQGIPVRYAATIYARFPSIVFAKADRGIATPADLAGRTIGTPGKFGTGWITIQALLGSAGLTTDDVTIALYPYFDQGVAVALDQVDAATGFINNEPVQLELQGFETSILRVDDVVPLPGPGLVVGEAALAAEHDALAAFVAQTLRAMDEIRSQPERGLAAAIARVPELGADPDTQLAILDATIDAWSSPVTDAEGLGAIDEDGWARSVEFLTVMPDSPVDPLATPVTVEQLVTTDLLPALASPSPSAAP
jgi:NitT/TauT family transport system substrate-binding protein